MLLQQLTEKDPAAELNYTNEALGALGPILLPIVCRFARIPTVYFWLQMLVVVTLI